MTDEEVIAELRMMLAEERKLNSVLVEIIRTVTSAKYLEQVRREYPLRPVLKYKLEDMIEEIAP